MNTQQILIVEDDAFQRNVLASILQHHPGAGPVHGAGSAEEALVELDKRDYSLIFLDLGLPGQDGLDVLRTLGEKGFTGSVAVVSAMDLSIMESVATLAELHGIDLLGAVSKPITMQTINELLQAKEQRCSDRLRTRAGEDQLSTEDIESALEEDRVVAFFQPKVDLATGRVIGHEVLARIRDRDGNIIAPASFIAVAEKSGQIERLTLALTEQAFSAHRDWKKHGRHYKLSINLSLHQRSLADFLANLDQSLPRYEMDARQVIVEVTESAVAQNPAEATEILMRLRMHGYGLSIDDFGTGYSSLEQLQRLPFSELKVDRGFVTGICTNARKRAILESSISMAEQLNLKVVCEGIETAQEYELLKQLGCHLAQGYYIARPLPADQVEAQVDLWEQLQASA